MVAGENFGNNFLSPLLDLVLISLIFGIFGMH